MLERLQAGAEVEFGLVGGIGGAEGKWDYKDAEKCENDAGQGGHDGLPICVAVVIIITEP